MAVTDVKGSVVETYNYTPYGELIDGEYREDIPFLYNGQYGVTTDSNGFYYMRARYYNVEIKRFINQDLLLGVLERVSSLNRYAYVDGNPISYLDPFGLERVWTQDLHKLIDDLTYINYVVTFISPEVGLVAGALISSFEAGLYIYDIYGAFVDNRLWDALKDFGYLLLDFVNAFTARSLAVTKIDYDKVVDFDACKKMATELGGKLQYIRNDRNVVSTVTTIKDFLTIIKRKGNEIIDYIKG